ncbi:MAG TPA: TIGR01777 family oxidoreductase [Verrucomicrobiae bacterium]|nr:TIGR01777 family oxidoreductase [Verrucomicrobiae bacterium]
MQTFRQITRIEVDATALERWHLAPGAFQRLAPPWERMRILQEPDSIVDGARAIIQMKAGPLWVKWVAEHKDCRPGIGFTDVQVKGPFAHWEHVHTFRPAGAGACELVDEVHYRLPLGFAGQMFGGAAVRKKLERMFRYRHAITKMDLERERAEPGREGDAIAVLITGATGMVGAALEAFLRMRGHRVLRLTRNPTRQADVRWDPSSGELDLPPDERVDAVVHLAGENIAGGRWSEARKRRILESRRLGTRLLCEALAARTRRPAVLVSASGANFYGTGTAEPQDESSPRGTGFLSDVCEAWEGETVVAERAGIRVVRMRFGVILSPAGGALAKMLPLFQLGLGGRLGSGNQRMPWIALDDVVDIVHRALRDPRYEGPVNGVAPELITNARFTSTLARTVSRPAVIPAPGFALKLVLGKKMAEETLLADLALAPGKLKALEYPFRFPRLPDALGHLLGLEVRDIEARNGLNS